MFTNFKITEMKFQNGDRAKSLDKKYVEKKELEM